VCFLIIIITFLTLILLLQLGHKNRLDPKERLSAEEAVAIVKDVFVTVTERDIHTGDSVEIKVIRKSGITTEVFQLKQD
jgi:20S proteasome subunit beta 6